MNDYDDDDIIDYENDTQAGEQFNEDNLNDEDYNLLYDLLPELKEKTKLYQIPDDKLKELLWLNYFELDDTLEEIKRDFKPVISNQASKLEQLSQKRKLPSSSADTVSGTGSKLSNLLLKNKTKDSQPDLLKLSTTKTSGSGLLGLAKLKKDDSSDQKRGLAGLLSKNSSKQADESPSIFDKLKARNTEVRSPRLRLPRKSLPVKQEDDEPTVATESGKDSTSSLPFEFEFTFQFHAGKIFTNKPSNTLTNAFIEHYEPSITSNDEEERRRMRQDDSYKDIFNILTNNPEIAKKTTSNFQKPSPDEQKKELHKITQIISGVNLEESSKPAPKKKLTTTKPKTKINVDKELQTKNQKPNLSFVVIGHVDSGKSTMIGRLLYDLKIVDSKTLHKLTKESENIGKASFSLAWIMDQTSEERSRGVTVDICQTQFETETSSFTIIDSPGHKDYVPQMINGVTQADIAIVIIDANSFESGFDTQGQTREHLTIAKNLGMEKCIIAINKMDTNSWSEHRFEQIRDTLAEFLLDDLQYEKRNIIYIPVSGYLGDNVVNKVKKTECPWYSGKTLIEILEQENQLVNHAIDKESPFIMTINDIQELSRNDELLISGRINSGLIQPGESIIISPSQETGVVDSISITMSNVGSSSVKNDLQKLAIKGEFVELKLKKLDVLDNIKVGDLVTLINNKITPVKNFQCELNLFNLERPLLIGTPFILFRSNISIPARLSTIHSIENTKSGKVSKKRKHLSSNNRAIVDIEILDRDIPLVTFDDDMKLGRLVIRKDGMTIGAGKVTKLL